MIIGGPTATGKTSLALTLAKVFNGELISADSRQVYKGMDIVTGKDIPRGLKSIHSRIYWRNHNLSYYRLSGIKLWLTDVVLPDEQFNVSFWQEISSMLIKDISSRGKLPIIVGGTGLYIKSLIQPMSFIHIPVNDNLRSEMSSQSWEFLFTYLQKISPNKALALNESDRKNPRRLVRAIEIAQAVASGQFRQFGDVLYNYYFLGLTASRETLYSRVESRVMDRIENGAFLESQALSKKYGWDVPSMSACGYKVFKESGWLEKWIHEEKQYIRRQLNWFSHQKNINWFNIDTPDWKSDAQSKILDWYNKN